MHSVTLEPFPPGNPFHHDTLNVGSRLADVLIPSGKVDKFEGHYIMGAAFQDTYDLYIVNSATGERLGIKL